MTYLRLAATAAAASLCAACASTPDTRTAERWTPDEDEVAAPAVRADAVPDPSAIPLEAFEDASLTVELTPASVPAAPQVIALPAVPAAAEPAPSYVVASAMPTLPESLMAPQAPALLPPPAARPSASAFAAVPGRMEKLDALRARGGVPEGATGWVLLDAESGAVVSESAADTGMAPASVAKIVAALAIVDTMGLDGTFRTTVLADGPVEGGVLRGDLHLVGSGDPTLSSADMNALAAQVAASGIRSVEGRVVYHADAIPQVGRLDGDQPGRAAYNPPVGGLNVDRNLRNGAPVANAGRFAANAFRAHLGGLGITVPRGVPATGAPAGNEVAGHDSQPVSVILTQMFDESNNMTAEALGAAAAVRMGAQPSSLADAAATTTAWLQGEIGGIGGGGWSGFSLVDHSGLSRRSRVTPRQMAEIVRYGHRRHGHAFTSLYEPQMAGNLLGSSYGVQAKIGTMRYVRGLGGMLDVGGRQTVFAIFAADPSLSAGAPEGWMMKARRLENALINDWIIALASPSDFRTAGL